MSWRPFEPCRENVPLRQQGESTFFARQLEYIRPQLNCEYKLASRMLVPLEKPPLAFHVPRYGSESILAQLRYLPTRSQDAGDEHMRDAPAQRWCELRYRHGMHDRFSRPGDCRCAACMQALHGAFPSWR